MVMNKNKIFWLVTILLVIVVIVVSLCIGTVKLSIYQSLKGLFVPDDSIERMIVWYTRFPRIIIGGLVGASLAIAGVILQSLLQNNLASPSTIGVTSGASFFGYLFLVVIPSFRNLLPMFTILGSLLSTMIIYFLAYNKGIGKTKIILAGLAISTLFGAFIDLIKTYFADSIGNASGFLVGGLNGVTWSSIILILPYFIIAIIIIIFIIPKLDIILLGEETAKSLGINTNIFNFVVIILAAILSGSAVAVAGLISFVGLIIPHIARFFVGSKHSRLIPAAGILGFILVIMCDTIGRVLLENTEVPVSIILALIGAPFFIFLIRGRKNKYESHS